MNDKNKGEYVTRVMGEVLTDALIAKLDKLEEQIKKEVEQRNYFSVKRIAEDMLKTENLRMEICTNHIMEIRDYGAERDEDGEEE